MLLFLLSELLVETDKNKQKDLDKFMWSLVTLERFKINIG